MDIVTRIKAILNRNTQFLKQLGSSYAVFGVNTLIMIFQTPLLLNYVGSDTYGIWLLAQNIGNYLTLLNMGFISVMINKYAFGDPLSQERNFSTVFFSILFFTILSFCVFVIIVFNLTSIFTITPGLEFLAKDIFLLMYFVFVLNFIASYFDSLLYYISGNIITKNIIEIARISALFLLYWVGVKLNLGIHNLCLIYIGVTLLFSIITIVFALKLSGVKISLKHFDFGLMKNYFIPGASYLMLGVTQVFVFNGDNLIIASLLGTSQLTAYTLSFRLSDVAIKLIRKLTDTKTPQYISLLKQKEYGKLKKIFFKIQWPVVVLSLLACAFISLFGKEILELWLGEGHGFDRNIIIVFALYIVVSNVYYSNWVILNITGDQRALSKVALIEVVVNVTLSIILCKFMGLIGIALATLISTTALGLFYSQYRVKILFKNLLLQNV